MYQQGGVYGGGPPMYGMYGYDPRSGEAGSSRSRSERDAAPFKFTEGKLFIGGVEASVISKDELVEYCSRWGEVADAVVMDRKGYGFVTFADPKAAMEFLEHRGHELKGRRLDAKASVPKAHLGTAKLTKKMFVGGTGDLTDQDFRDHFGQYGHIEDAAVVRREGQSRGFGFVTFTDEISVEKCLLVSHYIKGRKVELKRAVPKDEGAGSPSQAMYGYPAGPYSPQPGMLQQQFYPMPYGAGPAAFGMRPAFPPSPSGMGVPADPYSWYNMGYMPYYPASGMYPPPYGMMPQPGMAMYGGMPYMPPGPSMAEPRGPSGPESSSAGGTRAGRGPQGSSSSRVAAASSTEASSSNQQRLQQQQQPAAASPAGPSTSPELVNPPGVTSMPGRGLQQSMHRNTWDPPTSSSRDVAKDVSSGTQSPPGLPPVASSGLAAPPSSQRDRPERSMMAASVPIVSTRPQAASAPQRAMGPGVMQYTAAGITVTAAPTFPGGFALPSRPVTIQGQQQQPSSRPPQQQTPPSRQ